MNALKLMPIVACFSFIVLSSCSTERLNDEEIDGIEIVTVPQTKQIEIEILELINQYRLSMGLNALEHHDTVKAVAFTHTDYMVEVDNVSHDNFFLRKISLQENANAQIVSENVAYGFSTASAVVNAWIDSDSHKEVIEGDFTDFDISAEQNDNGKWFFTNIFIKR